MSDYKVYEIENLCCANCGAKIEKKINDMPEVEDAILVFATKHLRLKAENPDALLPAIIEVARTVEADIDIHERGAGSQSKKSRHAHAHDHDHQEEVVEFKVYEIEDLCCANCGAKIEKKINDMPEVEEAVLVFETKQLRLKAKNPDALLPEIVELARTVEPDIDIHERGSHKKTKHSGHHDHDHDHEHHHKHEDHCCDHDHEHHHHEHAEGEACSCGCDHDHDHDHHHHEHEEGEACSCGCDHDHEHHDHHDHDHHDHEDHCCDHDHNHDDHCCDHDHDHDHHEHDHDHEEHAHEEHEMHELDHDHSHGGDEEAEGKGEFVLVGVGIVLFVASLLLEHVFDMTTISIAVSLVAYVILGASVILKAFKNIGHGNIFDENFLMSLATIAAICIGDFTEAVGVMLFYRIGELFEDVAVERSRSQIMEAVDLRPETVTIEKDGKQMVIPADEAEVGDVIIVRPGDRIPLDGTIVEGVSQLDTSAVTGEPVPVGVGPGSEIFSGCVNEQGVLKLRVDKPLAESMVSRILDSVENAAASKPKIDRFITRFARIYTPAVVGLAVFTAIVPSLITHNWHYWIYTAVTFLVISCPCALVLSVPLAFFSGIGAGSKFGILFKGGLAIETIAEIKAVVMDKTGTLTRGDFVVQKVVATGRLTEKQVLTMAADVEQHSTHPIARSIIAKAQDEGLQLVEPKSIEEISGKGIKAVFQEGEILCGNKNLMEDYNIDVSAFEGAASGTEVLIALEGKLIGYIQIDDEIKEEAKTAIARMKAQNLTTAMLTGDAEKNAEAVAEKLGIDQVFAKLLPEEKMEKLEIIRKEKGRVMFVGDGINDAPVLASADVGAAMGSGADAAIEAADIVFMNSSVEAIPLAVEIARKTNQISKQNVVFALAIKGLTMLLGLFGLANMWMAVFADTGVAIICILNSIRVLYRKYK